MTTKRLKRNQGTGKEGAQRAPMPAWIPRPVKRESGLYGPVADAGPRAPDRGRSG